MGISIQYHVIKINQLNDQNFTRCYIIWYSMVWYGMVWYGMVWYGMVRYGTVWYGTVRYNYAVWFGMLSAVLYSMVKKET